MSKFKCGDEVVCIDQFGCGKIKEGSKYKVVGIKDDGKVVVVTDCGDHWEYADDRFELSDYHKNKSKPHTETDRRKAAKAVRELQEKLKKACDKAKEVGIKVKFQNACVDLIDIEMTYQPETPKMRKY